MSEPLKPHEVVAHAALVVADPNAEMRAELRAMLKEVVKEVLNEELTGNDSLSERIVRNKAWLIKDLAKSAIKDHFNSPMTITNL